MGWWVTPDWCPYLKSILRKLKLEKLNEK